MITVTEVINKLKIKARPDQLAGMARFGLTGDKRLGLAVPEMRKIAKELGKDNKLALALWKTGIPDAMMVAAMIAEPDKVTEKQMEDWVKDVNCWDVGDQLAMNLFEKVPFTEKKIFEWAKRREEFVRRMAFAMIACLAWHDKKAKDETFVKFLPLLKDGSIDERNYVKKAVSWALRNMGKRSLKLNKIVLQAAKEIQKLDTKPSRWVASDVIRELESVAVRKRLGKS